jgi:hypothetical protein
MDFVEAFFTVCGFGIGTALILGIPFGFAAYVRKLKHDEIIALAEKGLVKAPDTSSNGRGALRWGIAITGLGIALCVGLYPFGFLRTNSFPLNFGPWMLIGLLPTFFGLALVIIYLVTRDKGIEDKKEDLPTEEE